MDVSDYVAHDATGIAALIRDKQISAEEACRAALSVHELTDVQISAVIEVWDEQASTANNTSADQAFGGVPFLIKDIILTAAGRRSEAGSRLAEGIVAPRDTELMRRFRRAGLVTLGRTKTPEFGLCSTTEPVYPGAARNPWNLAHSTGGSSGGSAAAVAARVVPIAHASDGAGSIRIPSSCCGVFGLKPSRGRITCAPDNDELLCGLATEFVVSRTVRDSALMLDAVRGAAFGDPFEIAPPETSYSEALRLDGRPLKVGLITLAPDGQRLAPRVLEAVTMAGRLCSELGHVVEPAIIDLGMSWEAFVLASAAFYCGTVVPAIDAIAAATARPIDMSTLEPQTLACYEYGRSLSATDLLSAMSARHVFVRSFGAFFRNYDLLLTPTLPQLPLQLGQFSDWRGSGPEWIDKVFRHTPFTPLFNLSGRPAMSVPLDHDEETNLPIGIQFGAAFGREDVLLRLAVQLEEARPWIGRRPAIVP